MSAVVSALILPSTSTLAAALEVLGVQMGMTRAALQETLSKNEISTSELEPSKIAVPRLPVPLEGVREARLLQKRHP